MRKHRRQIDDPGRLIDCGGLHGGDFVLAKGLAHDLKPTRQRGIAKRLFSPARSIRADGRH